MRRTIATVVAVVLLNAVAVTGGRRSAVRRAAG